MRRPRRPRSGRRTRRPACSRGSTASSRDIKYTYTRGDGTRVFKVVSFYLLRYRSGRIGEIPPGMEIEVAEARWLPLEEAPRLLAYGGERQVARLRSRRWRATRLARGPAL